MGDGNWFRKGRQRSKGSKRGRNSSRGKSSASSRTRHSSLSLEQLEDRRMLVVYLVANLADLDVDNNVTFGSLRWAVEQANAEDDADQIVFADSAFVDGFSNTLSLNGGQLTITQPLSILGPGPRKLTIAQSQNNRRIFETNIGADDDYFAVQISGVTLSGGNLNGTEARGGAIYNREFLTMVETNITGNSAAGGGGVFTEFGRLNLDRSLVQNNVAGIGGGIMNGSDADDNFPNTTITNSTITGNSAVGIPGDDGYLPYGGGVFNRNGRLTITSSTIVGNDAIGGAGAGVASWGNEPPEPMSTDPPPAQTVLTFVGSSILYHNLVAPGPPPPMPPMPVYDDIAVVGMTDDDPPMPLLPSVFGNDVDPMTGRRLEGTLGYNIIHTPGDQVVLAMTDQPAGTDPGFIVDGLGEPLLADYGGSTNVFMLEVGSPALDAADPLISPLGYEQRGFRYARVYNYGGGPAPIADVGAVERQAVTFVVDELFDEAEGEGQTAGVYQIIDINLGLINVLGYESPGDFTLREAIAFARKNVEPSVVEFAPALRNREFENDPNADVTPATLTLTLGQLTLSTDTVLIGPTSYILEIDASGNDTTPLSNDGIGSRVLQISAGVDVTISNLTFMGGDINNVQGGAGILSYGDLTLIDSTIKENYAAANGSGVAIRGGTFTVSGTTFNNNTATINGGALFADANSIVFVANSTFSGNTASGRGGAIANGNADLTIQSSTITLNTATTTRGSGIWTLNGAGATTKIGGSIISQNTVNDVEYATGADTKITSNGYNLVGTGNALGRFNQTGDMTGITNPMLEPLMITGGQTATHRPKTGSPVLDVGDPNFDPNAFSPPLLEPLDFDQRGPDFARIFDGDGVGGDRIDIGAYELQSAEFVVSTEIDGADGNYEFGFLSLREAIKLANDNPLPDRIVFDPTLVAQSPQFSMNASSLAIDETADMRIRTSMVIEGPGSGLLTLDGAGLFHPLLPFQGPRRFFTIDDANAGTVIDVEIRGLSLIDATTGEAGGAILSRENLTLEDMAFVNNHTTTFDPLLTGVLATGLHGGAIYQDGAALTINNSTLTGNYTDAPSSDGGGLFAINATVNFFYNTLSGNTTLQGSSRGGGMAIKNSTLAAAEMSIIGNATNAGLSDGGGVYVESSNVVFEESAFGGNSTAGSNSEGGAVYVAGATSQVAIEKNSTLSLNRTTGTQSSGGAAYVAGGTLTINNSALIQNSTTGPTSFGGAAAAGVGGILSLSGTRVIDNTTSGVGSHGGGLANLSGNINVRDSLITGNRVIQAQSKGGGVFSDTNLAGTQTTTIVNSTISGNTASLQGGGLFNADGLTDIRHSTITNNSTPFLNVGNGIASWGNAATQTRVESSIIAGNAGAAAGTGSDVDFIDAQFVNSFQSLGYNVIGTGNALAKFNQSGDKIGITNPLLGPLAANGGLTATHALLDGSPAINAGKPSFNASSFSPPLTTDQRGTGFARVLGGRIDAGAFESSFTPFSADFDLDGDVDGSDFLVWQRFNGLMAGGTKSKGDANSDGKVNGADLTIWRSQVGAGGSGAAAPASEGSSTPAVAAAVVAAPEEEIAAPATLASSPLAVVTASATTALETTSVDASASSPSSPNYVSIASGGIPSIGSTRRLAYRPEPARGSAHDVVHASDESSFSRRWATAAASAGFESRFGGDALSEASEGRVDAEDSVFAMLGDGAL
jgi:hypothetical protein